MLVKINMKLVVISDTHGKLIHRLPLGDVLIHCGDYSSFGTFEETKRFFDWFSSFPHKIKIVVPGNHEVEICPRKNGVNVDKILSLIRSYDGIHFLIDKEVVIDGVKFFGTPWCNGDPFIMHRWGFFIGGDRERKEKFEAIPDDVDVLISHIPPWLILDDCDRRHLGCFELRRRVKQTKPLVHCFGHIHDANGHLEEDGIHFFNCSNLDEDYNLSNSCRIIEIEEGELFSHSTSEIREKSMLDRVHDELTRFVNMY